MEFEVKKKRQVIHEVSGADAQSGPERPMPEEKLESCDIRALFSGQSYHLSVNGAPVKKYKVADRNCQKNQLILRPMDGKPRVHINADKVKQLAVETEREMRHREEQEKKKRAREKEESEQQLKEIKEKKEKKEQEETEEKEREKQEEQKRQRKALGLTEELLMLPEYEDNIEEILLNMIKNGIHNLWMVGPAGCGKSTIARIIAGMLKRDIYVLSCGIGTSSTEFIGYKYPKREATPFSSFYTKPSIIVLDEFTALDPSVAQIANAALANDELYTTTELIRRSESVIIATSNTFGTGGDMSYVANNQLDASTIDRFVGGIVKVDYSPKYESKFDSEIREYVNVIRGVINENQLQRIASTRMIIQGEKLKKGGLNWKSRLIENWTPEEKQLLIL